MRHVLYVFSDPGVPGACKIGKDLHWPSRFKQARCHTPRGIVVEGVFGFTTKVDVEAAERAVHRLLPLHRRLGDVNEWFDLPAAEAIRRLQSAAIIDASSAGPAAPPSLPASARFYDDWRDHRPAVDRFRWQLWLFREQAPEQRLKLAYGALHDTAFRYAFTYNPWPVRLVAGFEHRSAVPAEDDGNRRPNAEIRAAWEAVQHRMGSPGAEEVGWLKAGSQSGPVSAILREFQIVPFRLDRPKPPGVRPKDSSVAALAIGAVPPQSRVCPCPAIYPAEGASWSGQIR